MAPTSMAVDGSGNLLIADSGGLSIRKITAGTITTIAGGLTAGSSGFTGDNGPATAATLSQPFGVVVDKKNTVYIADGGANRIRAIFACVIVPAPSLQQPSNASSSVPTSPRLAWSPAKGAFHYDVYLDTANPPQKILAADITALTYSPANLEPLTQYYWKVVAKGDPFCTPFSNASSEVWSFTTLSSCSTPSSFGMP